MAFRILNTILPSALVSLALSCATAFAGERSDFQEQVRQTLRGDALAMTASVESVSGTNGRPGDIQREVDQLLLGQHNSTGGTPVSATTATPAPEDIEASVRRMLEGSGAF